jgi:acyl dehydratase
MAVNRDYLNHSFPRSDPYEVSRVKIRDFADAIGDGNPVFRDQAAAQAAGHPDVIAPPTFPMTITAAAGNPMMDDPELGVNYAMVVHGEQRFEYTRPLVAGDVVTSQATITGIRQAGSLTLLTTRTEFRTPGDELVCTAYGVIVERGA